MVKYYKPFTDWRQLDKVIEVTVVRKNSRQIQEDKADGEQVKSKTRKQIHRQSKQRTLESLYTE